MGRRSSVPLTPARLRGACALLGWSRALPEHRLQLAEWRERMKSCKLCGVTLEPVRRAHPLLLVVDRTLLAGDCCHACADVVRDNLALILDALRASADVRADRLRDEVETSRRVAPGGGEV